MSALATRAHIHHHQHYYLTPLTRVGKVELIQQWIAEALAGNAPLLEVCHCQPEEQPRLIATGYSRLQSATDADGTTVEWTERVMLIHSPVYEQQQGTRATALLQLPS